MYALLIIGLLALGPLVHADSSCEDLLSSTQVEALTAVGELKHSSAQVFKIAVGGRDKILVLVGEPTHQGIWDNDAGRKLYRAFDRLAFSFRHRHEFKDRLVGRILAPVIGALFKLHARLQPKDERDEIEDVRKMLRAHLLGERKLIPTSAVTPANTAVYGLIHDPFSELADGRVFEPFRLDLDDLRNRRSAGERLRTINLERGFSPGWPDRLRDYIFSIDLAGYLAVNALAYHGSPVVQYTSAIVWAVPSAMLAAGLTLYRHNARPWYKFVAPFVYVGDRRRNIVAAANTDDALRAPEIANLAVVVEQRRVADLRARLLARGFTSIKKWEFEK